MAGFCEKKMLLHVLSKFYFNMIRIILLKVIVMMLI